MNEKIKVLLQDRTNKIILIALVISLFFVLLSSNSSKATDHGNSSEHESAESADTVIPNGYVLVPIEIQNIESLASLIGSFGVIDLFTTAHPGQKSGLRVGRRLKLLRAPLNPQQFAVLVPENEASLILQASGPFFAVIQNPADRRQSEIISDKSNLKKPESVEYFKGGHQ